MDGRKLALSTVKTFNDLAGRAAAKGSEMLALIWKAGETAKKSKESLEHGEWMPFVEQHYDVDHRTVTRWIKFQESVPESKLDTVSNLTAGLKMIEGQKTKEEPKSARQNSQRNEASGKEAPPISKDLGKCPNCAGTKWTEDEFGWSCAKCHHPHGEPVGDVDEDRIKTQRSKTVKTVEALMRAFDDLQAMSARSEHSAAIESCKHLLKIAKAW